MKKQSNGTKDKRKGQEIETSKCPDRQIIKQNNGKTGKVTERRLKIKKHLHTNVKMSK